MSAKKEAAPCDAASSGERRTNSTASADAQPHLELTKLFLRCGPRARREFLADVRAAQPALWQQVTEGTTR